MSQKIEFSFGKRMVLELRKQIHALNTRVVLYQRRYEWYITWASGAVVREIKSRKVTDILTKQKEDQISKRKNMKVSSTKEQIEFVQTSKVIHGSKVRGICVYDIRETLERLKFRSNEETSIDWIYALTDVSGNVTGSMEEMVKANEILYVYLYASNASPCTKYL